METRRLELRRQVQRVRYRYAWWLALCAGVAANALLALALWATAPHPVAPPPATAVATVNAAAPVVVSTVSPPVIVMVPAGAPAAIVAPGPAAAFADLGPCPAPSSAAPRGPLRQPPDAYHLRGVRGAPSDARWVAAWSETILYVTRDGGGSWQRVLDGAGTMLDATFDCHGRVLALRTGGQLGVRDGVREAWHPVPDVAIATDAEVEADAEAGTYDVRSFQPRLVGGGRLIAVIGAKAPEPGGEAVAALSGDAGATWWHADLGWYEGADLAAAWRGDDLTVLVPWTDCMSEGVREVVVGAGGTEVGELDGWVRQLAIDRGAAHGVAWPCPSDDGATTGQGVCVWRDRKGWSQVPFATPLPEDAEPALIDGPVDIVWIGATVAPLRGAKLGTARPWPADATPVTSDLAGRVWGLAQGELVRR